MQQNGQFEQYLGRKHAKAIEDSLEAIKSYKESREVLDKNLNALSVFNKLSLQIKKARYNAG